MTGKEGNGNNFAERVREALRIARLKAQLKRGDITPEDFQKLSQTSPATNNHATSGSPESNPTTKD